MQVVEDISVPVTVVIADAAVTANPIVNKRKPVVTKDPSTLKLKDGEIVSEKKVAVFQKNKMRTKRDFENNRNNAAFLTEENFSDQILSEVEGFYFPRKDPFYGDIPKSGVAQTVITSKGAVYQTGVVGKNINGGNTPPMYSTVVTGLNQPVLLPAAFKCRYYTHIPTSGQAYPSLRTCSEPLRVSAKLADDTIGCISLNNLGYVLVGFHNVKIKGQDIKLACFIKPQ